MTVDSAAHQDLANAIRFLSIDAVQAAANGHPGMPMGMADVATVLFGKFMRFDPQAPEWPDRDRFILSAGHGSMLLYSLLYLTGYPDMTVEQLKNFRQLHSRTAGHPEYREAPGIDTTTGPLGAGIATSVGFALAERHLRVNFGEDLCNHRTYVIAGDGCMQEGVSHEGCSLAGHQKLGNLIVLYDDNKITIDGDTSLSFSDDTRKRFEAYGWVTDAIDGHDPAQIERALTEAQGSDRPVLIACRTTIGFGAPNKAGGHDVHGSPLGEDEVKATREALNWPHPPFEVPEPILSAWRAIGSRGEEFRKAWEQRLAAAPADKKGEFERRVIRAELPAGLDDVLNDHKKAVVQTNKATATRKSSAAAINSFVPAIPELLGGSADLTGSNNTKAKTHVSVSPDETPGGTYFHYGVREHGMSAAMNGLALHGGCIPFGGTFFIFSDYARPQIRLSALMKNRVIYVLTHDSIGLGADGPTHQAVEHLASLRAMPNLWMMRPCDSVETAECWLLAIRRTDGPACMALTRQDLPLLRDASPENLSAKGAYVIAEADGERKATLLATGSEVSIAMDARNLLQGDGIPTAVVSMPCWELFEEQDETYKQQVLGTAPRVAVEAGSPLGWTRYVAKEADVVGMTTFGASAPYKDLYKYFGITPERVAEVAKGLI